MVTLLPCPRSQISHPLSWSRREGPGLCPPASTGPPQPRSPPTLHSCGRNTIPPRAAPAGVLGGPSGSEDSPQPYPLLHRSQTSRLLATAALAAPGPEKDSAWRELSGQEAGEPLLRRQGTWGSEAKVTDLPEFPLCPCSGQAQPVFKAHRWVPLRGDSGLPAWPRWAGRGRGLGGTPQLSDSTASSASAAGPGGLAALCQ